ncbi:complex I NDUFA9 subunit family protein [Mesorhizobium sp. YIM 152430]|uniref:complex I NDUFA9 subunit family protein n=1 Tax=Mesorhizobium sp. YIM 152430 TaxID=3031761 RepID=UPI0023DC7246|nr:complex I NDUFA9 subunit family protein [Mesorhizobium sp. YIM 152430]MDF1601066.1 complex I NDUFA9 subunit family protein [Mesorhizobium sp. YIM 152430]
MTPVTQIPPLVTIIGGSGFVGRYVVRALAKRGYRIRVVSRNPNTAHHLQPLGNVGQIHAVRGNLRNRASIDKAVEGAAWVINLVGILSESGAQTFDAVQAAGARMAAEAARDAGARFIQMSAIGADANSSSDYGRTKAEGEAAAFETLPDAIVFRPSIVFGPEDGFFNRFAAMARLAPALPMIGGGKTMFQPVYVGDVAEAFARAVDGEVAGGKVYELGGPEALSFRDCMKLMLKIVGRKRLFVTIPWKIAEIQGAILGRMPKPLLTRDQVELLKTDNVVSPQATSEGRTLEGLGIRPQAMEAILPTYLWTYRAAGQFTRPQGM